ncbi:ANTAR domain-containing protein [Streptomyces sp. 900105755]
MHQATAPHAVADHAFGVLASVRQVPLRDGWEVLQEVSRRLNTKRLVVADQVVGRPVGRPIPYQAGQVLEGQVKGRAGPSRAGERFRESGRCGPETGRAGTCTARPG